MRLSVTVLTYVQLPASPNKQRAGRIFEAVLYFKNGLVYPVMTLLCSRPERMSEASSQCLCDASKAKEINIKMISVLYLLKLLTN